MGKGGGNEEAYVIIMLLDKRNRIQPVPSTSCDANKLTNVCQNH